MSGVKTDWTISASRRVWDSMDLREERGGERERVSGRKGREERDRCEGRR
jgi:hypothetical protein